MVASTLKLPKAPPGTLLNARVTACHEPAKSTVKASVVTIVDGQLKRQPLRVEAVANSLGGLRAPRLSRSAWLH